jgi:lipopolysaccharide/colanic/teichoic acid biosynthesis glycosyltransferase
MVLKRALDLILSFVMLLLLSPALAAVALVVWLDSGGPVLFRQERVGLRFRRFNIVKFRTMRNQTRGPSVTFAGDTRITRIGQLLRPTKLDELPQFWNVLLGDMSLVGPRPEVPEYVDLYSDRYRHILTVRPGITDLGSIRFRDEERILAQAHDPATYYANVILPAKLDLADHYIRTRSFRGDAVLLWKTLLATAHTN